MSLSSQAVSAAALSAQESAAPGGTKAPSRRTATAKSDVVASPEAR